MKPSKYALKKEYWCNKCKGYVELVPGKRYSSKCPECGSTNFEKMVKDERRRFKRLKKSTIKDYPLFGEEEK